MHSLSQEVLRTDVSGMPLEWIDYRDAVRLHFMGQIAYTCGQPHLPAPRWHQRPDGPTHRASRSTRSSRRTGTAHNPGHLLSSYVPPLNNETLFRRDAHLCMYCGQRFSSSQLSRDHVTPLSRGGRDRWNNVVTACRRCNNLKAWRTPEQAQAAAHRHPVHAELCRVHLPEGPARTGRPDGIPARAFPALEPVAQAVVGAPELKSLASGRSGPADPLSAAGP